MSDQEPRPQLVPAEFSDHDTTTSKWILFGFAVLAGGLIVVMALPRILERF